MEKAASGFVVGEISLVSNVAWNKMPPGSVIVTDGNERAALAVTRSLGQHGLSVYVGAETVTSLSGVSRYCSQSFVYPSPWSHPQEYVSCLIEAVRRWQVTVIIPMTDVAVELIGEHAEQLRAEVVIPMPSLSQYHKLSDKYQLTEWAAKQGIPLPDTIFVPDGIVANVIDQITAWPVVVKPGRSLLEVDGEWKKTSVLFAHNPHELRRLYHEVWYLSWPSLIQQRIAGEGQGVFGLFDRGKPLALFAHRRLREKPPSGGVSVLRESIPVPQAMADYAVRVAQSADWHGVAMVEFKVDTKSGIPYLMEVNGRFWGSLQLAVDAGIDFPWLLYQFATSGAIGDISHTYQPGIRSRWWLGDLDHLMLRWRNAHGELVLPPGSPSRWATTLRFLHVLDRNTKSEVFRLSDPKPGIHELADYGRSLVQSTVAAIRRRLFNLRSALARTLWDAGLHFGIHRVLMKSRFPETVGRVLILCKGNICRSPFADQWLQIKVSEEKLSLQISSAGLDTVPGKAAFPLAAIVSREYGIDLGRHRTVTVSEKLVADADIILVMELAHIRQLLEKFPDARRKTFLLGHFAQSKPLTDIRDPYGDAPEAFARCYSILSAACDGFLVYLRKQVRQHGS